MPREKTTTIRTNGRSCVVGLDIGSSKIAVVIAEIGPDGGIPGIVGVGSAPAVDGINGGRVLNVTRAAEAIQRAVAEAEKVACIDVRRVNVGIAGRSAMSMSGDGQITISKTGDREIGSVDVARVIEQSSSIQLPPDSEILDVIPNEYRVDGQLISDPCGCTGFRLEAQVQLVLVNPQDRDNLVKAVERAGFAVDGLYLGTLASAEAALSEEEKKMGVALVDLGASSTNLAVFCGGTLRFAGSIPFGSDMVTHDLSVGLNTNVEQAERVKCEHGACSISSVEDGPVTLQGIGNRPAREVRRSDLAKIIAPRVREILMDVRKEIDDRKLRDKIVAGYVLTGGGSALRGIREEAEKILELPVSIGEVHTGQTGLGKNLVNQYTEGVGLVQLAAKDAERGARPGLPGPSGRGIAQTVLGILRKIF